MSSYARHSSIESLVDILVASPDLIETTKYRETGVQMFLIGEDGTSGAVTAPKGSVATDSLGQHLAELSGALARRKPELDDGDVANLLEVLAELYFLPHGQAPLTEDPSIGPPEMPLPATAPPVLAELTAAMAQSRTIRLINFHATPRYREAEYRRQFELFAQDFEPITSANFADAIEGRWKHERPGLMPALFEGYRDNLDVLLPIIEEFGFQAWFFVPSAFLSVPADEQRSFAAAHTLHLPAQDEYPGERIALTWDEARVIASRGHAFACHTRTHNQVTAETPHAVLADEIVAAKAEMEAELGSPIEIFCWLEGAALGVNAEADDMLRQAGFRFLFSNFKIQTLQ